MDVTLRNLCILAAAEPVSSLAGRADLARDEPGPGSYFGASPGLPRPFRGALSQVTDTLLREMHAWEESIARKPGGIDEHFATDERISW